jgi:hypothetical protein
MAVAHQMRAQTFRDHEGIKLLVPRQISLVVVAASQLLEGVAAGHDLGAVLEVPLGRVTLGLLADPLVDVGHGR